MVISIFYSWQSEHPELLNRYFIRDALEKAIKAIKQEYKLEESLRVDYDTKGTPGAPEIVNTIFSKIERSSVFVADVSFTSKSTTGRLCANPNVLIELGFALKSLGGERLILVMNDEFGSPKDHMPFNLAARRWPIIFTLSPNADKETRKKVLEDLTCKLKDALKAMAESGILLSTPATSSSISSDRVLFTELLEQFPYNSDMIYLLRDNDVGNSFPSKWLEDIDRFTQNWNNALHEFIDPTLEAKRKDFMVKLTSFQNELWSNTWRSENRDFLFMATSNFKEDDPRWEKIKELNVMGTEAYDAYQELVRACKATLGHPEVS